MKSGRRYLAAALLVFAAVTAMAQAKMQKNVASTTAKFGAVSKTDDAYTKALDAHDLQGALKLVDQPGAFKGTVSQVYEGRDIVIFDFDRDYKTALTAVIKTADFSKFPDVHTLDGKELLVSGKFINYQGKGEIELTDPAQINIIK